MTLDFFGIYDGHGGKQAATYASRHLPDKLLEVLPPASQREADVAKAEPPPELQSCKKLSEEDWVVWEQQEALVSGLPEALVEAFQKLQSEFFETTKVSSRLLCDWLIAAVRPCQAEANSRASRNLAPRQQWLCWLAGSSS